MALPELTERDHDVIKSALRATIEGPFFPDWEFETLFGCDRSEVRGVLGNWPDGIGTDPTDGVVYGALRQLVGYPHDKWEAWALYSDASEGELKTVLRHYSDRPHDG
jgi:hypothetical protein